MQAGPIVAQRAAADQPEQHCSLAFPPEAGAAAHACGGACGAFDAASFHAALTTRVLGRVLLTAAATASTQVVVQENSARLPDGLVFVADKQMGGKGEPSAGCGGCFAGGLVESREGWGAQAGAATGGRSSLNACPCLLLATARPQAVAATGGSRPAAASCSPPARAWPSPGSACPLFSTSSR